MATYQMLVRNLEGTTLCLQFPSRVVHSDDVREKVAVSEGVPEGLLRLVTGTLEFSSGKYLEAGLDGFFPSCAVLVRLRGGKGGFGSLLRGAATKAGQKKTSNFDACRDMSGRRLRHVNAEKKLKEWRAEAKERELEKTAEDFMKKRRKTEEEDQGLGKELEKFRKESLEAREDIGSAVTDGLVEAKKLYVDLKRKKIEALEFEVKKARTWSPRDLDEEDESEDEDDQVSDKIVKEASTSKQGSGESSPSQHDSEETCSSKQDSEEASPSHPVSEEASLSQHDSEEASPSQQDSKEMLASQQERKCVSTIKHDDEILTTTSEIVEREALPCHLDCSSPEGIMGPLDFEQYSTSKELEVLGLERLKIELLNQGLKCGGSLSERAARLFLLKTTPLEKLDKKLFSKPVSKSNLKTKGSPSSD